MADPKRSPALIRFRDEAYTQMLDIKGVELSDCQATIADIEKVFHDVAEVEMLRHNAAAAAGLKKGPIPPHDMPGLDAETVCVEYFTVSGEHSDDKNCLLPTSIVTPDGTDTFLIRLNANFVRLMHMLSLDGLKDHAGDIHDCPAQEPPVVLGNTYWSILYSVALHALRGALAINDYGFAVLAPNRPGATGQRGRGHGYVNTLAMLFYWVVIVELNLNPIQRVRVFMKKYPQIFDGLSPEQAEKLPQHLYELASNLVTNHVIPKKLYVCPTGMTEEDMAGIVRRYAGGAFNEGLPPA